MMAPFFHCINLLKRERERMNLLYISSVGIPFTVIAIVYAWKFLNWAWLTPKKLEKSLRQQGFSGNSYSFLLGDLKEIAAMEKESLSKPISFSEDFLPRIMPFLHKTITTHGKKCFVWFGTEPAVFIWDLDNIREILSKPLVFQKPSSPIGELLAKGVASYEADKWAKHRRLINPAFHIEKIKNMAPSFYMSCCDMLSEWEKIAPESGEAFELDVWPSLATLTGDAISRTAFGSSYEQGRKIFELQKELAALLIKATLSFFIPGVRFLPTRTNRRIKHIKEEVESLLLDLIDKRMKAIEAGEAITDNLLDILLESNFKEMQEKGNKFGMSLQDVVEECKLFYIAGQETTSCLLVWTMILLSKHLDWQARARDEVLQAFGSKQPDFQGLNGLKVVSMILDEVLRLYPPAFMTSRITQKETAIGDLRLPSGVNIILPILLVHHDHKLWGEDAKEFKPERFSEGVSKATKGPLSYFPFGWGPRICIGQNFAVLEAKMALAMILRRYSFELSPSYSHAPTTVVFLQPQHGAHLILRRL